MTENEKRKDIRITNSDYLRRQVEVVAKNYGISITGYLKQKIKKILDEEPEHMKRAIKLE